MKLRCSLSAGYPTCEGLECHTAVKIGPGMGF